MLKTIISKAKNLWSDSLYRNSFWLMSGSFAMAGIGLFYWMIAARLYTPEQIGLAATFLSAVALINSFAMLGFSTTLIRYLPTSEVKEKKINTAFTVVSITALVIGVIYLIGLPIFTNKLLFIRGSIPLLLMMIIFFPINTINGITDSVFTAFREAHWVFVSNITQSAVKLVSLVFLSSLGVWGVIGSNMVAIVVATLLCLILISKRFNINFKPTIDEEILLRLKNFALGNYVSGLIGSLPNMILPIIITNRLSPAQTAYFYMPNMIAGLLNVIPSSIARSYFTESSHADTKLSIKKPLLLTFGFTIPLIALLISFGKKILSFFGSRYSIEGYGFLVLISISVIVSILSYFLSYRLLLCNKLKLIVIIQSIISSLYILAVYVFSRFGIIGIGISILSTKILELIIFVVLNSVKYR